VFGYDEEGVIKNDQKILVDENGEKIGLDKLLDTYFGNPEDYFIITKENAEESSKNE
jgi:hypothetical protein